MKFLSSLSSWFGGLYFVLSRAAWSLFDTKMKQVWAAAVLVTPTVRWIGDELVQVLREHGSDVLADVLEKQIAAIAPNIPDLRAECERIAAKEWPDMIRDVAILIFMHTTKTSFKLSILRAAVEVAVQIYDSQKATEK